MLKKFTADPSDHMITFTWGDYPGDRKKGFISINQRALEAMPGTQRSRLLALIKKAQRGVT